MKNEGASVGACPPHHQLTELTNAMNVRFALILAIVCTRVSLYTFNFTNGYCESHFVEMLNMRWKSTVNRVERARAQIVQLKRKRLHFAISLIHEWIDPSPTDRSIKCLSIHAILIDGDPVERITVYTYFVEPDEKSNAHRYPDERGSRACIAHIENIPGKIRKNRMKIEGKTN